LPYNSPTAAINDGRFFHYILIENHNPDGREATRCRNKAPLCRHTKITPGSFLNLPFFAKSQPPKKG
jgi:hypothetical protein